MYVGASYYINAHFGKGTGPILLDGVTCSGSEPQLLDCNKTIRTTECSHANDAGVICQHCKQLTNISHNPKLCVIQPYYIATCQDGDVRLFGGWSAYEGQVEVCLSQR